MKIKTLSHKIKKKISIHKIKKSQMNRLGFSLGQEIHPFSCMFPLIELAPQTMTMTTISCDEGRRFYSLDVIRI